MKRAWIICIVLMFLLVGCSGGEAQLNRGVALRESLLQSQGCGFTAEITANFTDQIYQFSMDCAVSKEGTLTFTVQAPESIAGITGKIAGNSGKLIFDDQALSFPLLADGEVSPVSAPWLMIRALMSGYLTSCGMDGDSLRLTIDDSYADNALQVDIWLDSQDHPARAELLWQGRRVLSLTVKGFSFL